MSQTSSNQTESPHDLSPSNHHDKKINSSHNNIKETFSSKKKHIRKRNYQRRKKLFIVHSLCILDNTNSSAPKYTIETILLQDKKPRNWDPTVDVSNIIQKKDDEHLKRILER